MRRGKRWVISESRRAEGDSLARDLDIAPPVARLLVQRGYDASDDAHRFLSSNSSHLHDPRLLPDMDRSVARIRKALESGERITVYGDYDTDGVTSAALLGRVLKKLACKPDAVVVRVPHRRRDGYGLSPDTIDQLAADGASLIVSADCGISAMEGGLRAKALGIDLIITDHHEPGETLPEAYAIINPKRADSRYPFRDLAGVGVAFKLGEALSMAMRIPSQKFWPHFLDLVTLGTVADNAPLVDENRALVRMGLPYLAASKKQGVQALLGAVGASNRPLNAGVISFNIAPRLNAVGRVDDAALALELLMTTDAGRANELVRTLEDLNNQRREEQERIWKEAKDYIQKKSLVGHKVLLVAGDNWHKGIVGIVAGRLADQFHRPALVVSTDDGVARGSARSASNFPMIEALRDSHDLLLDFGGHAQAAGFNLDIENLEELRARLNRFAETYLTDEDIVPSLDVDMEVMPDEVCARTLQDLALMEPFGSGNREPLWVARNLLLIGTGCFGKQSERPHLSMKMRGEGMNPTECVWWRMASRKEEFGGIKEFDVVFRMEPNFFANGALRLNVQDVAPSEGSMDGDFGDPASDPWVEDAT